MNYFAHTATTAQGKRDPDRTHWQPLRIHLSNVAAIAKNFAAAFGCDDEAEVAGLLHDLGKYAARFQLRLRDPSIRGINHWAAGAACAAARKLWAAAFAIDGHHTGIPALNGDGTALRATVGQFSDLKLRLNLTGQCPEALEELLGQFEAEGLSLPSCGPCGLDAFAESLRTRMIFSCVVDADFLDTEKHFEEGQSAGRAVPSLQAERAMQVLQAHLSAKPGDGPVNAMRRQLLNDCLTAASRVPGLFTLTAPTGCGKTLSSLAFALRHIIQTNKLYRSDDSRCFRRIIVVIPFTSVIEQTAGIYRDLFEAEFGPDFVLEHHSAVAPRKMEALDAEEERLRRARLAAENWTSPIVVTTSVQFFESLFSNRPSDCRKLHNIARSVVLFDEVQTLPSALVPSLLSGVGLLARDYGVSAVFMTATQPAFASLTLPYGWNPEAIASNEASMADVLRRTRIELPHTDERLAWGDIAASMAAKQQCLCVVNTTRDARELFRLLRAYQPEYAFHLSARMCPAHRLEKLALIRRLLRDGLPCRLVATQLIEAGVDVDFPAAWRAFGPLDSIIQTAGRCNREGRIPDPAPVIVSGR